MDVENRFVVAEGEGGGKEESRSLGLADETCYMGKDKQQDPTVYHRGLSAISWDKSQWKQIF